MKRALRHNDSPMCARDRGAVMVELAFILPILVMLLVGIIEFGRAYSAQVSIQGAAREGARALALGELSGVVDAAVKDHAGSATDVKVGQDPCLSGASGPSDYATVTVTAQFEFSIPFWGTKPKTLEAKASMRCGL